MTLKYRIPILMAGTGFISIGVAWANDWSLTGNAAVGTGWLGTVGTEDLILKTAGTERTRITASGDVGIGLAAPASRLHVHSDTYVSTEAARIVGSSRISAAPGASATATGSAPNGSVAAAQFQLTNASTGSADSDGLQLRAQGRDGYLTLYEEAVLGFGTRGNSTLYIDEEGQVGVRTRNPEVAFQIEVPGGSSGDGITLHHNKPSNGNSEITYRVLNKDWYSLGVDYSRAGKQDFYIEDEKAGTPRLYIAANGLLGVGTVEPAAGLHVDAKGTTGLIVRVTPKEDWAYGALIDVERGHKTKALVVREYDANNSSNATANFMVYSDGLVFAREIQITAGTFDYHDEVFDEDYQLMPLVDLEEYIRTNHHLPGIPSEAEANAEGLRLAESNMSLLLKVEELTLYAIELEKRNTDLERRVAEVELKVAAWERSR